MSQRHNQEDKFKNIVIKMEPVRSHSPDLVTTHSIKPTHSPTNYAQRASPFQSQPAPPPIEISTSHIIHENGF